MFGDLNTVYYKAGSIPGAAEGPEFFRMQDQGELLIGSIFRTQGTFELLGSAMPPGLGLWESARWPVPYRPGCSEGPGSPVKAAELTCLWLNHNESERSSEPLTGT